MKIAIYSGFSHEKQWFSIAMWVITRGYIIHLESAIIFALVMYAADSQSRDSSTETAKPIGMWTFGNAGPISTRWCPQDSVQLVQISPITMVYGWYIELVDGIINQQTQLGGTTLWFVFSNIFSPWVPPDPPDPASPCAMAWCWWWPCGPIQAWPALDGRPSGTPNGWTAEWLVPLRTNEYPGCNMDNPI